MTDTYLKIVDRSLRSQGPSQARVADALRILSDWYQEAQHDYREQHASADLLDGAGREPGARGVVATGPGEGDRPSVQVR